MANTIIELEGVSKEYLEGSKPVIALNNISLHISKGEIVSIIGPSGCGKTTLLRLIAGLISPSSGRISVDGLTPGAARMARKFAVVFQDPTLLPWRTVLKNIQLPAEILEDGSVMTSKAEDLIKLVGLNGFEHAFPRELSGGMRARVAIARALSYHPGILLMDEPFGALDEITREKLNIELLRIWRETGVSLVIVTHAISEAVFLSDRVIVLSTRPGEIVEEKVIACPRPRSADTRQDLTYLQTVQHLKAALTNAL